MNREQLADVLRAVSRVAEDPDVLVIGSQSILGSYPEDRLPPEATGSMEVDTAFLTDPGNTKSDRVDGTIGELSNFHDTHGYYPQGVSINTGVFPQAGRIAWLSTKPQPPNQAAGYASNPTTASWPSSSGSTGKSRTGLTLMIINEPHQDGNYDQTPWGIT